MPPSGPSVQYATFAAYDALNRPIGISWTPAVAATATTSSSVTFSHAYNKTNQRIGQTATDNSWLNYPAATPGTVSYSADALNRYTALGAVSPTYDGNSNLGNSNLGITVTVHSIECRTKIIKCTVTVIPTRFGGFTNEVQHVEFLSLAVARLASPVVHCFMIGAAVKGDPRERGARAHP